LPCRSWTAGRITYVTTREKAHQLLDKLPDSELEPVLEFIASRGDDSFARWLDSRPAEDEKISADESAAVDEAHAELAAGGPTVSHEEMKRELGLG
jgi:hypothetical protein